MYSDTGDTTSLVPGFPIRTSSDQRSVDNSPRHIAASHVLHRLLMPRHPPCALKHLQTQENNSNKTCSQISTFELDARNHYPQIKHHTPPPSEATTPAGVVSGPNSVSGSNAVCTPKGTDDLLSRTQPTPTTGADSSRLGQDLMPHPFRGAP
jgi:hypothetical protein